MLPLMIVSSISYAVSKQFETYSMEVKHLVDKGQVFTSNKDKNILSSIDVLQVVTTSLPTLSPNQKPEDVIALLSGTDQTHFAVVDEKNKLLGIVDFDTIKHFVFSPFKVKYTKMDEMMTQPAEIVSVEEDSLETIMEKFELAHVPYLVVLKDDRYYGFIEKCKVLEAYRGILKEMVIE